MTAGKSLFEVIPLFTKVNKSENTAKKKKNPTNTL